MGRIQRALSNCQDFCQQFMQNSNGWLARSIAIGSPEIRGISLGILDSLWFRQAALGRLQQAARDDLVDC